MQAVFEEDFISWTEEHFKGLHNTVISNLRDGRGKREVPIDGRPELWMSTAQAKYTLKISTRAFRNNDRRPNSRTNDEGQQVKRAPIRLRERMNS